MAEKNVASNALAGLGYFTSLICFVFNLFIFCNSKNNRNKKRNGNFLRILLQITKGLEDEKRCEKVAHAKEQIMLKNRLSRLSKV